ncbi:hypothetical protein M758_4G166200 [Ceratodon purpureus]|nr:hypothetical protein M758_4G166200 [Ceratodon purpureus]
MEGFGGLVSVVGVIVVLGLSVMFLVQGRRQKLKLPPSPKGRMPIIGHLHMMDDNEAAHQTFARISSQNGPLTMIYMGSKPTLLVSTAAMAEQVLKHNDLAFASRPFLTAGKMLGFDFKSIVFAPFGNYYNRLRRIYTVELLSPKRVALSQVLRQIEIQHVMSSVLADYQAGGPVNMTSKLQEMGIDNLVRMIFAKPQMGATECLTREEMVTLKSVVKEAVNLAGVIYPGDFIPLLNIYDFTGHKAKLQKLQARMFKIAMQLIERHRSKDGPTVDVDKLNLVDILLSQQGDDKLPDHAMAAVLFDFIIAGSDTTSVSIEWALAELLHYPHYIKRMQEELDSVVGKDRVVDESDIKSMPFLQAVVKELFRLHPAAPLGIPHFNLEATTLAGYDIPARTTVMLNLWAIGRDPAFWKDPLEFNPDRFIGTDITMMGRDFQLIPFSVGRRQCPGKGLGLAVVQLAVASLIHGFEWSTVNQKPEEIDMREKPGLVTPRMTDLVINAVPRLPLHVYQGEQYGMQNGSVNGH